MVKRLRGKNERITTAKEIAKELTKNWFKVRCEKTKLTFDSYNSDMWNIEFSKKELHIRL